MMVIRAFGNEEREEKRFDEVNTELAGMNRFVFKTMSVIMPAMMLIMNVVSVVIVWVGAEQIAASSLQVGAVSYTHLDVYKRQKFYSTGENIDSEKGH